MNYKYKLKLYDMMKHQLLPTSLISSPEEIKTLEKENDHLVLIYCTHPEYRSISIRNILKEDESFIAYHICDIMEFYPEVIAMRYFGGIEVAQMFKVMKVMSRALNKEYAIYQESLKILTDSERIIFNAQKKALSSAKQELKKQVMIKVKQEFSNNMSFKFGYYPSEIFGNIEQYTLPISLSD